MSQRNRIKLEKDSESAALKAILDGTTKQVAEHLKKYPLLDQPTSIVEYFEDDNQISEEDLALTGLELACKYSDELVVERVQTLKKISLLCVSHIDHLPMSSLISMSRDVLSLPELLPMFPDFPKTPSANLCEYFLKTSDDDELPSDEDMKRVMNSLSIDDLVKLLCGWRDEVENYISDLEDYKMANSSDLSEKQQNRITQFQVLSRRTMEKIQERIEIKMEKAEEEQSAWTEFQKIVAHNFEHLPAEDRERKCRLLFNTTDEVVRNELAKLAASSRQGPLMKQDSEDDICETPPDSQMTFKENTYNATPLEELPANEAVRPTRKKNVERRMSVDPCLQPFLPELEATSTKRSRKKPKRLHDDGSDTNSSLSTSTKRRRSISSKSPFSRTGTESPKLDD